MHWCQFTAVTWQVSHVQINSYVWGAFGSKKICMFRFFVSALASNSGGRGVESFSLNSQPAHPTPRVLYVLRVWENSQKHQFTLFVEVTNVLVEGPKAIQFLSAMHFFFRFPMLCNVRIQRRRWVEQKCSFGFAPFHLTIMKTRKKDQK